MKVKMYISLPPADIKWIAKAFDVSSMTVRRALQFAYDTELSARIRKLAYARGGLLVTEAPVEETWHDADGVMTQTFLNGAVLRVEKRTGRAELVRPGGQVKKRTCIKLEDLEKMQQYAAAL